MNKIIIVSLAIFSLSTSAALAAKHAKKPAAAAATTSQSMAMPMGGVSKADKELYAKNKRMSGVK